jgi:hypothetical protein
VHVVLGDLNAVGKELLRELPDLGALIKYPLSPAPAISARNTSP